MRDARPVDEPLLFRACLVVVPVLCALLITLALPIGLLAADVVRDALFVFALLKALPFTLTTWRTAQMKDKADCRDPARDAVRRSELLFLEVTRVLLVVCAVLVTGAYVCEASVRLSSGRGPGFCYLLS